MPDAAQRRSFTQLLVPIDETVRVSQPRCTVEYVRCACGGRDVERRRLARELVREDCHRVASARMGWTLRLFAPIEQLCRDNHHGRLDRDDGAVGAVLLSWTSLTGPALICKMWEQVLLIGSRAAAVA